MALDKLVFDSLEHNVALWSTLALTAVPVLCLSWFIGQYRARTGGRKLDLKSIHAGQNGNSTLDQSEDDLHQRQNSVNLENIRITKLLIHPVKSCRGISVSEAHYSPEGLDNDRKWCMIDAETHKVFTAREIAKIVLIIPRLEPDPASPHGGRLVVSVPKDDGFVTFSVPISPTSDVTSKWKIIDDCTMFGFKVQGYVCETLSPSDPSPSDIVSEFFGQKTLFVMKGPAPRACPPTIAFSDLKATAVFQDAYPLLVASEESLDAVVTSIRSAAHGAPEFGKIGGMNQEDWKTREFGIERFRPNIVFKGAGVAFAEDMWREIIVSSEQKIDVDAATESQIITVVAKCARCLLPNVDPRTGERDSAVPYKVLMKTRYGGPTQRHKPLFGCNGVWGGDGIVRVGDHIHLKKWAGPGGA